MLGKLTPSTLALLAMSACAFPAHAQDASTASTEDSAPQATTAAYRDWTLRCEHLNATPRRKVCEVVQAVRTPDGQQVLAQIVIGRPAPDQPTKLIVQLPPGVWIPAQVTLSVPSGERVTASYTQCLQICASEADIGDDLITALKSATEHATLAFQDGNRRPIELPVSLVGLTAAIGQAID